MPSPRNTGVTKCNRTLGRKATGRSYNAEQSKYNKPRKKHKSRPSGTTEATVKKTAPKPVDATPLAPKAPSLELPKIPFKPRPVTVQKEEPTATPGRTTSSSTKTGGGTKTGTGSATTGGTQQLKATRTIKPRYPEKKVTQKVEKAELKGEWEVDPNKKRASKK